MAPKLPIINILTPATSAQNRGGSPMKEEGLDHRIEFFDPKTRPVALFWDNDALLTAPESMMRNTGVAIFWRAVMNMGYPTSSTTPLSDFNRRQVFDLAKNALPRLKDVKDPAPRIDLCIATFLQNREVAEAPERAAAELERIFTGLGIPIRLSQTKIPKASLPFILDNSMKNFNAIPSVSSSARKTCCAACWRRPGRPRLLDAETDNPHVRRTFTKHSSRLTARWSEVTVWSRVTKKW